MSSKPITMTLSPADADVILDNTTIPSKLRALIQKKRNATESRSIKVGVSFEHKQLLEGILNPHMKGW